MTALWELVHDRFAGSPPGVAHRLVHTCPWPVWGTLLAAGFATVWILAAYAREKASRRARIAGAFLRCVSAWLLVFVLAYGWQVATDLTDMPDLVLIIDDSSSMLVSDVERAPRARGPQPTAIPRFEWVKHVLSRSGDNWLDQLAARYRIRLYRVAADLRDASFGARPGGEDSNDEELSGAGEPASSVRDGDPIAASGADVASWTIEAGSRRHGASRLGEGLRAAIDGQRGRPTAAVVLLSDGITTDGQSLSEAANEARRREIPLHIVGVGSERTAIDARISDVIADDSVFIGDVAQFDVRVAAGGCGNRSLTVRIRDKTAPKPLAEKSLAVTEDAASMRVPLAFRPERIGDLDLVIEVDVGTEDINPGNNRVERHLRVRDEVIRVLYAQGYPSFDYRQLKSTLERGFAARRSEARRAVELAVVLQESDAEYPAIDAAAVSTFPVDRDALFRYDVIVMGDADEAYFTRPLLEQLSAFVKERGGGLVLVCGPRSMPWAYRGTPIDELIPIDMESASAPSPSEVLAGGWRIAPSPLAREHPIVQLGTRPDETPSWDGFPDLRWLVDARALRPAARVLVEAHGPGGAVRPAVVTRFVGAGKVVMVLSDEFHRLARHPDGSDEYDRFWLQTLRYLSRGKSAGEGGGIELRTDRPTYPVGEPIEMSARFMDERRAPAEEGGVTVRIEQVDGPRSAVTLARDARRRGLFHASISGLGVGDYRAWLATPASADTPPSVRFTIEGGQGESARAQMDLDELREAASRSRGAYYSTAAARRLLDALPEGRHVRVQSLPPRPIWNAPVWPALLVALFAAEWLLRKKAGML